jgi:hypothetical protein
LSFNDMAIPRPYKKKRRFLSEAPRLEECLGSRDQ